MLQTYSVVSLRSQRNNYKDKDTEIEGWTFALQACSDLKVLNAYNAEIQKLKGGCSRYTFHSVAKVHNAYNTEIQKFQDGRSRLTVHNAYRTKIEKLKGGRSRYKRFAAPTI